MQTKFVTFFFVFINELQKQYVYFNVNPNGAAHNLVRVICLPVDFQRRRLQYTPTTAPSTYPSTSPSLLPSVAPSFVPSMAPSTTYFYTEVGSSITGKSPIFSLRFVSK